MESEISKIQGRGQITIPKTIREKLKLKEGDRFIFAQDGNIIIMKRVEASLQQQLKTLKKKIRFTRKQNPNTN